MSYPAQAEGLVNIDIYIAIEKGALKSPSTMVNIFFTFSKGISSKVKIIVQIEIELMTTMLQSSTLASTPRGFSCRISCLYLLY